MFLVGCTVASVTACGPGGRNFGNGTPDAATGSDSGDAPPAHDSSQVYGHSGKTLYIVDTTTLQATTIGPLTGLAGTESLTDLAVDNQNHMAGISLKNFYTIDPATGTILSTVPLDATAKGFTALSYVPAAYIAGANASDPDVLVTANGVGDVYRVDPVAGSAMKIGNYGLTANNDQISSSGDLVGIQGLGIFATVNVGTETNDYLARIDPANGYKATLIGTGTGFDNIFGLGFWAGKLYGFVDIKGSGGAAGTGKVVFLDSTTGFGQELMAGNVEWYGAGVETNAPIIQ